LFLLFTSILACFAAFRECFSFGLHVLLPLVRRPATQVLMPRCRRIRWLEGL
jgi:hypothetical protein